MFLPRSKGDNLIPVIVEAGSFNIRAGFAGEDAPLVIEPSVFALTKTNKVKEINSFTVPEQEFNVVSFSKNPVLYDWNLAEIYIQHLFEHKLGVQTENSPFFVVESPIHNREFRLNYVEMMLEKFKCPSIYFHKSPLLTLYVYAKENGLILDVGANYTYVTPILDGFIINKGIIKGEFGGEYLTKDLYDILNQRKTLQSYHSVKNWREKFDPNMIITETYEKSMIDYEMQLKLGIVREIKETQCKVLDFKIQQLKFVESVDNTSYELPDKTNMVLSKEMYSVPEKMFRKDENSDFAGLQSLVQESVEKVDFDVRKELLSNIILTGGGSLQTNFMERLQKELFEIGFSGLSNKIKIFCSPMPSERKYSNWLGASILGSLSTFNNLCMTKQDYEEHGAILIERKCYF